MRMRGRDLTEALDFHFPDLSYRWCVAWPVVAGCLAGLADLGYGVLDSAMVESRRRRSFW